jgi:hypothetical protein
MTAAYEIVEHGFDFAIVSAGGAGMGTVRVDRRAVYFHPLTNESTSIQSKERIYRLAGGWISQINYPPGFSRDCSPIGSIMQKTAP